MGVAPRSSSPLAPDKLTRTDERCGPLILLRGEQSQGVAHQCRCAIILWVVESPPEYCERSQSQIGFRLSASGRKPDQIHHLSLIASTVARLHVPVRGAAFRIRRRNTARRIGGLILEVKGDICQGQGILEGCGRGDDYVEISLDSPYRYNPLHNDLDAYALAYGIASLLNNLFGKGKEPFWQQAYTNLVKFIILLHKVLYDYVTLFDVYECAINPDLLEQKIVQGDAHSGLSTS